MVDSSLATLQQQQQQQQSTIEQPLSSLNNDEEFFDVSTHSTEASSDEEGVTSAQPIILYKKMPTTIRDQCRRSLLKEYPVEIEIPLVASIKDSKVHMKSDGSMAQFLPYSDAALYDAIKTLTGKIGLEYTAKRCALCTKLKFRVCDCFNDKECIFCIASGVKCKPARVTNPSTLKQLGLSKNWFLDVNKKLSKYIEGFEVPETFSQSSSSRCGLFPPNLCLDSDFLDGIHRAASFHSQKCQEWYGEEYFGAFDTSALIMFGLLGEELIKSDLELLDREQAIDKSLASKRRKRNKFIVPELLVGKTRKEGISDMALLARLRKWKELNPLY